MSQYNKAKGSRFEIDIEDYLNSHGVRARRLPRAGAKDIGDVAFEAKACDIVIEAKNVKDAASQMAQFLREAEVEASHYEDKFDTPTLGVVITKTRQKGAGQARVVMELDTFISLLRWNGVIP